MYDQMQRHISLLARGNAARSGRIAISSQNDGIFTSGPPDLAELAEHVVRQLDCGAVIVAEPALPMANLLIGRTAGTTDRIVPRDSESRSSLHDLPVIRKQADRSSMTYAVCDALSRRRGCIAEGIGLVSRGSLTIEQASITWSSLVHATFIKYFEDLLVQGPKLAGELEQIRSLYHSLRSSTLPCRSVSQGNLLDAPYGKILTEMARAGRATVAMGLVDSFFGNISWSVNNSLYISQTSARLDQLQGQIDQIILDGSSSAGLTASSELPAHRSISRATGCRAILHGHPRFSVIMSLAAASEKSDGSDLLEGIPIVDGGGGIGGMAESLTQAFLQTGSQAAIVRGHGVFTHSRTSFTEALQLLAKTEERCRELYFTRLFSRWRGGITE